MRFCRLVGYDCGATWDDKTDGGDCSILRTALSGVSGIYSTSRAFAAIVKVATVVTWGFKHCGSVCSIVKVALRVVDYLYTTNYKFAVILKCGTAVTWGSRVYCRNLMAAFRAVDNICSTEFRLDTVLKEVKYWTLENGTAVTWGDQCVGGVCN